MCRCKIGLTRWEIFMLFFSGGPGWETAEFCMMPIKSWPVIINTNIELSANQQRKMFDFEKVEIIKAIDEDKDTIT